MKTFLTALCLTLSLTVHADVSKMAVITSEFDENVTDYFIETNKEKQLESMRYITTMPNGGIFEDITVTADQVINDGAVIVERDGRQIVRLEVENFNVITGGTVILNFLYNGVTGSRNIKKLQLKFVGNEFQLFDADMRVNKLFLVANRSRVLGIIGVKKILASFSQE